MRTKVRDWVSFIFFIHYVYNIPVLISDFANTKLLMVCIFQKQ